MKIKAGTGFKMPKIFFHNMYANGFLFFICLFYLFNFLISSFTKHGLEPFVLVIVTLVVWGVSMFFPLLDGAYKQDREEFKNNISDVFRSAVYMVMVVSVLLYQADKAAQAKYVPDEATPIAYIRVFEKHDVQDFYGIRYYDDAENLLYTDMYNKIESRSLVLERIYDDAGKIKVEMSFIIQNGKKYVLINDKMQRLNKDSEP